MLSFLIIEKINSRIPKINITADNIVSLLEIAEMNAPIAGSASFAASCGKSGWICGMIIASANRSNPGIIKFMPNVLVN